ncbi:beta-glucan synthesis-associated protein [Fomitiporia mediterranea MF3/22]|uniref:beta-glucan synthesis-associated protein n=1 Tax=Fomitiporia mediterranea (strain MF3/22) TaxID=694068 RepID=UPI00044097DB|nr:beta-glucan synthesis-associated protein [Fomitiporia mediterranea MF3/22]EJC99060.1 beta-glucan synthesis-associated protein [Fomitiporia mediterranea MF3/22]
MPPQQYGDSGEGNLSPITPRSGTPLQGVERPLLSSSRPSSSRFEDNPYSVAGAETPPRPPYARSFSDTASVSERFSLQPDPKTWGTVTSPDAPEPDDALHMPDPRRDKTIDMGGSICTPRGIGNLGCLFVISAAIFGIFAGYPIASHYMKKPMSKLGGFNIGGTNMSGQIPLLAGNFGLIDEDTPDDVKMRTSYIDGSTMELVFSDEFNQEGRSFYPGDDPYWEAVDLHYWGTNNLEWYDPSAVTTKDGYLHITLSNVSNHGLYYMGGMITSWNKFCFTGGILEASVSLPGASNIHGLWPAVWAMGNLGRAGYGASLEGMWPYTYDACDVGTLPNQTLNGLPVAATENGDPNENGVLSFLQGQRLSRCTCPGESHPGPMHSDGTFVGRAAPEIDVFEATISFDTPAKGQVSQSGQWAPFNAAYAWKNTSDNLIIVDPTITELNSYAGSAFQQATSGLSFTNQKCYELSGGCFSVYGFEYKPGFDDAYIGWITDDKLVWRLNAAGMGPDDLVQISARPVPQEPMYVILNLGISEQFGFVDFEHLTFPTSMRVDYIRVYQRPDEKNVGCDPPDFPTAEYIQQYQEAYINPNLTTWVDDFKQKVPKNKLVDQC